VPKATAACANAYFRYSYGGVEWHKKSRNVFQRFCFYTK